LGRVEWFGFVARADIRRAARVLHFYRLTVLSALWGAFRRVLATFVRPGVIPTQRVVARWTGEDAVDEEGVGVGGVDADAVTRGDVFNATSVLCALCLDVSRELDERIRAFAV
jgi:hypothetical protein